MPQPVQVGFKSNENAWSQIDPQPSTLPPTHTHSSHKSHTNLQKQVRLHEVSAVQLTWYKNLCLELESSSKNEVEENTASLGMCSSCGGSSAVSRVKKEERSE